MSKSKLFHELNMARLLEVSNRAMIGNKQRGNFESGKKRRSMCSSEGTAYNLQALGNEQSCSGRY